MAWRLARSLQVLERETLALHPGTTVWDLGDPAHAAGWSDHNPNECCDVVCATDTLGNAGLDLGWFADTIVATDPPALKYVIYNRRIWLPGLGWQPYHGSNPHTGHVHTSVGWGPDGRSTGNYDDESPWGLLEDDMSAHDVWETDGIVRAPSGSGTAETNTHWRPGYTLTRIAENALYRIPRELAEIQATLRTLAGESVSDAVRAELDRRQPLLVSELVEGLAPLLAEELADLPAEQVEAAVTRALARTRLTVDDGVQG